MFTKKFTHIYRQRNEIRRPNTASARALGPPLPWAYQWDAAELGRASRSARACSLGKGTSPLARTQKRNRSHNGPALHLRLGPLFPIRFPGSGPSVSGSVMNRCRATDRRSVGVKPPHTYVFECATADAEVEALSQFNVTDLIDALRTIQKSACLHRVAVAHNFPY